MSELIVHADPAADRERLTARAIDLPGRLVDLIDRFGAIELASSDRRVLIRCDAQRVTIFSGPDEGARLPNL